MHKFLSFGAFSLCAAGILVFSINAFINPFLEEGAPFHEIAASDMFLLRQGLSAIAALLLIIGSISVYLKQIYKTTTFGHFAFIMVCLGNAALFAQEWSQVFVIYPLADISPDALIALESNKGINLLDAGALLAFSLFVIGWVLFTISIFKIKVLSPLSTKLIVIGLFATSLLSALLPVFIAAIIGNSILGFGWFILGRSLYISST